MDCSFNSYPEIDNGVENGVSANIGNIPEEDMSIASSTDDTVAAAAVFRHLGNKKNQVSKENNCVLLLLSENSRGQARWSSWGGKPLVILLGDVQPRV